MHPENAIDNGDFIKILVYKFILIKVKPGLDFFLILCIIDFRKIILNYGFPKSQRQFETFLTKNKTKGDKCI